ncbi:hypothetical protein BX666DRAFT_246435 [Dichotomocladium elegans]|nr:hypothetical protein BX666DRAFT_246435 [Dichotomocladium elegans]
MERPNKPSLCLKEIQKPLEREITALSPSTPSAVAATLLSDSLFPPRKPRTPLAMGDDISDSDDNSTSDINDDKTKKDPLATQVWRLYTKAKDTLPNASRMENLTWRMMAMTLNKNKGKSSVPSTPSSDSAGREQAAEDTKNDGRECKTFADDSVVKSEVPVPNTATTPPAPDDTTGLLSSSAPPYMIDFFSGGPPFQKSCAGSPGNTTPRHNRPQQSPRSKSVFVYGSTRATSPSSSSVPAPLSPSPASPHVTKSNLVPDHSYFPHVTTTNNSITIPVDMPMDSDMEEDWADHPTPGSQHDPASPMSMPSPFGGSVVDPSGSFLSHSLPNYQHMPVQGQTSAMFSHQMTTQARSQSMFVPSSAHQVTSQPSATFNTSNPIQIPVNPGAMSFEELLSMYYAGNNTTVGTPPSLEPNMLSSQNVCNSGGSNSSLTHASANQVASRTFSSGISSIHTAGISAINNGTSASKNQQFSQVCDYPTTTSEQH